MPKNSSDALSYTKINDRSDPLTSGEVADLIGIDISTLWHWRQKDPPQGPDFYTLPSGHARYQPEDVRAWLEAQMEQTGTADEASGDREVAQ